MSTVLVTYASRTGSTREIAEAVADELRQTDHRVTLVACSAAPDTVGFDAAVIGSALHGRRWMPDAVDYLRRQARYLANRPTFLFQSGPCSHGTTRASVMRSPNAVRRITRRYGLTDPVTFTGRIDSTSVPGRSARWAAAPVAPGDYRDWTAIRAWGYAIGFEIHAYLDHRPQRGHDLYHPLALLPTRR